MTAAPALAMGLPVAVVGSLNASAGDVLPAE
jgi:hypothetical protein